MISAFQADGPGSNPGRRIYLKEFNLLFSEGIEQQEIYVQSSHSALKFQIAIFMKDFNADSAYFSLMPNLV